MNVKQLIDEVIKKEGGFVNDPLDKGGATKYGITQGTFEHFVGFVPTSQQMNQLDKKFAAVIYEQEYYFKPKINELPPKLQSQVFDIAVNSGSRRAYKLLQSAINTVYGHQQIVVDGLFGSKSKLALNELLNHDYAALQKINNSLVDLRVQFYKNIVDRDSTQSRFLKGWINRAESFRK